MIPAREEARAPRAHDGRDPDAERAAFAPDRWAQLMAPLGVDARAPVALALSGGADSVYLLRLAAAARPRPPLLAVHVDHGLRGARSDADARFCRALCARLDLALDVRRVVLDPRPAGLEARARAARYQALCAAARARGIALLATAHQADDALETLLLRWIRGADLAGLPALRARGPAPHAGAHGPRLEVVRPLLPLRGAALRAELAALGQEWCEDATNADARHARNALRTRLLPALAAAAGPRAREDLHDFLRAAAGFAAALEAAAPRLSLEPSRDAPGEVAAGAAAAGEPAPTEAVPGDAARGGSLPRAALAGLARPLARCALARLLAEVCGALPRRATLEALLDDLGSARRGAREVRGGWRVHLARERIHLSAPRAADARAPLAGGALRVPGGLALCDGRRLDAAFVEHAPDAPFPRERAAVHLDARGLDGLLSVRTPRRGDRFRALGAPGTKSLARFLADQGLTRAERARIPLVVHGDEILWVAGLRPSHARRVRADTRRRLALTLGADEGRRGAAR